MSDEFVLRLVVVAGVGLVAVLTALFARRGSAVRRRPIRLPDFGPGVVFFSASTCGSCAEMRRRLSRWPDTVEVSYETAGDTFPPAVGRVPAVALLDGEGRGWIAHGVIGERRLERWIAGGP